MKKIFLTFFLICAGLIRTAKADLPPPPPDPFIITNVSTYGVCDGGAVFTDSLFYTPISWHSSLDSSMVQLGGRFLSGLCAGKYYLYCQHIDGSFQYLVFWVCYPMSITETSNVFSTHPDSCNGSVGVEVQGVVSPTEVQWNSTIQQIVPFFLDTQFVGLCPGNYSLTVYDVLGCNVSRDFEIMVDPCYDFAITQLAFSGQLNQGICDGSILFTLEGGTLPYSYFMQDTIPISSFVEGLCQGSYELIGIDSNGCTVRDTVDINLICTGFSGELIQLSDESFPGTCNGLVQFQSIGGMGSVGVWFNDTIVNSTSLNGLCNGNYSLQFVDSIGCRDTLYFTIGLESSLGLLAVPTDVQLAGQCDGQVVFTIYSDTSEIDTIFVESGSGNLFFVDSSLELSNLCPGEYYAWIISQANDTAFASFIIADTNHIYIDSSAYNQFPDSLVLDTLFSGITNNCQILSLEIDSVRLINYQSTSPDSISTAWVIYDGSDSVLAYQAYWINGEGVYELVLQIFCDSTRANTIAKFYSRIDIRNGIITNATFATNSINSPDFLIFPNPFDDRVSILGKLTKGVKVELLNEFGQRVLDYRVGQEEGVQEFSTKGITPGFYTLVIRNGGILSSKKLVKY